MKNYQFAIIALLGAAIAAAILFSNKAKKPCGCGKHSDTETATAAIEE